jgi:predicted Rossmann fold flavoprotein
MPAVSSEYDVIILGAGAAGLMCAIRAGQRGRRVLLLDHAPQVGAKILISGGGRCNFTNTGTAPERFLSDNPHFCRSALSRYRPADFVAMVERHRIAFHEKTLGQLFCNGSARQIVAMLLAECAAAGVDLRVGHRITDVGRADRFLVGTDHGSFATRSLVLATGGISIPKMGATGFAYEVARHFGLRLTEIRPGLVPLTFDDDLLALMRPLSGVSLESVVSVGQQAFREATLFTHRGLSGPAVLQISSYWRQGKMTGEMTVNLLPDRDAAAFLLGRKRDRPKAGLGSVLAEVLPARLAAALADVLVDVSANGWAGPVAAQRMADVPDRVLAGVAAQLSGWKLLPSGTEGYAKAEVTVGGVDTRDLSSRTMAANDVPGLFVIGEAVDVTGWLGGYNFQWAWASGWCAGEAV